MMYLGTPGRMVGIKCPTTQQVTPAPRYSFTTTLGGVVKAQVGPVGRRTWQIGLGRLTTPADVGTLMEFVNGAWGAGPFWFIPADAPVVNVLTPAAAACDPTVLEAHEGADLLGTPPVDLGEDGVAARGVWKTDHGAVAFGPPTPVLPATPVTGSAWVVGAGRVRLIFRDATNQQVAVVDSDPSVRAAPHRLSVTTTPPGSAVTVQLAVTDGVTQATRPAITWTPQPYEWGDGQGCAQAIIDQPTRDVTKAWDHPTTGRWSDLSFTVHEVG